VGGATRFVKRILAIALALVVWASLRPPAAGPLEVIAAPCAWDDPRGVEARAVRFIDGAQGTLHAALYELSLPSVSAAMVRARARGVEVGLHLESDNLDAPRERRCLGMLREAGVVPTVDGRSSRMHHKFMVADARAVWTGSANLTWTGAHLHFNEALVLHDPRIAAAYERAWRQLSDGGRADGDGEDHAFTPAGRRRILLGTVSAATQKLQVAAFSLTDIALTRALIEARRRGVDVLVFLDRAQSRGRAGSAALALLVEGGVTVRVGSLVGHRDLLTRFALPAAQDVKIHHKLLVADGDVVVTGSANFSESGLGVNDEDLVRVRAAQAYAPLLEKLYTASEPL